MSSRARSVAVLLALLLLAAKPVGPPIPIPRGFVTDEAGVIEPEREAQITALLEELEKKTGAEVAVLTVQSTQPLDDFDYAMSVFDRWKVGKRGKDNGLLIVVSVRDRRVRMITGYGLEGILPDGKIGEIIDTEMLPAFREGQVGLGILRGVWAVARVIAADAGVTLSGAPPPGPAPPSRQPGIEIPPGVLVFLMLLVFFVMPLMAPRRMRRGMWYGGGGFGGGFGGGGGGGGGGFGGFGGGGSGGGGAGRGW